MSTMKLLLAGLILALAYSTTVEDDGYGVDCSWPVHSKEWKCGGHLGDRESIYEDFMEGCRKHYGPRKAKRCDETERDRIEMSVRQPQSMVNYTYTGFKKIRAPKEVMDLLTGHWERNKDSRVQEVWPAGNIYVNHWESPTYMVSVEDTSLRGGGFNLKSKIWEAAKTTIEEWTGMEQKPTSMYGIRVYTEGAILNPHVDRLPLVSSCIVNVAQDVDEDWILEVYDRQGKAVNVTMAPGDMVLYESGSLIHGRPFPLKGKFYANIFIHFEPTGRPLYDYSGAYLDTLDEFYPPYLLPDSPEQANWKSRNPQGWNKPSPSAPIQQFNGPEGHRAAAFGDVDHLQRLAKSNKASLTTKDRNGWQPIHEAVRAGHKDAVVFLIEHGADMNARTGHDGRGSTPLGLALDFLNVGDGVTKYLMSLGADSSEIAEL